jgi:hypothetical protein
MPLEISITPARFMKIILQVLKEHIIMDYPIIFRDNISIHSVIEEGYIEHIRW